MAGKVQNMAVPTKKLPKVTRETRISKEIKRLEKLLEKLPGDKLRSIQSLIHNAAFMTITLEDLQQVINQNGVVIEYQNGPNQWGTKRSPEVEIYNTMVKNHLSVVKQIADLVPESDNDSKDALLEFLKVNK